MKKFKFTIHGNNYEVEILNIEDNIADIEVNGSHYQVEIHKEIKTPKTPKLIRKTVEPSQESDKTKTHKPSNKLTVGAIKAPLPGTILKIKKNVGDEVKVGDTILVMEAMKMENNINADKNGHVKALKVKVSDSVLEGEILAEVGE